MHLTSALELTAAALVVEAAVGYPAFIYRVIGHPVTWMGRLLGALDRRLNCDGDPFEGRRKAGIKVLIALLAASIGGALFFEWFVSNGTIGTVLTVIAATTLLAQRSMYDHVRAVADALDSGGLEAGRTAVSMIVGRNPEKLDEAGVARAAIESLAENFSDGIVAPAFWMVVGGLPGAAAYKAANTADSMIGHRTPRFEAFGWAAARFDDLVNLPASRLAAVFIALGALATGASFRSALRTVWRDASRHRSPNAGWPEAAMAGALDLKLAGPRIYGDEIVDDAFMGDGRREATVADIRKALRIFLAACAAQWLLMVGLCIVFAVRA